MLSESEKKYLKGRLLKDNYKYVLKHRITKRIEDLTDDLDIILESKETFFKFWLESIFTNFIKRIKKS